MPAGRPQRRARRLILALLGAVVIGTPAASAVSAWAKAFADVVGAVHDVADPGSQPGRSCGGGSPGAQP